MKVTRPEQNLLMQDKCLQSNIESYLMPTGQIIQSDCSLVFRKLNF